MKKIALLIATILIVVGITYAQTVEKIKVINFFAFKQTVHKTNGVKIGIAAIDSNANSSVTNGLNLEIIGVGLIIPIIPRSPIAENDSEYIEAKKYYCGAKINGLNISASGNALNAKINGISIGYVGQIQYKVNGFSATSFTNFVQEHNGVMAAIFINHSYKMNGVQIGIFNGVNIGNGIQIGGRINVAEKFSGVQIALHNVAKNLKGIQIGLWNVNQKRKLPLINWNFKS
jgi:hypothetical protein